jgi:hypothetical protein
MASKKNDLKFPMGTQFLFKKLLFTVGEGDDLELQAQCHVERGAVPMFKKFGGCRGFGLSCQTRSRCRYGSRFVLRFCPGGLGVAELGSIVPARSRSMGLSCPRYPTGFGSEHRSLLWLYFGNQLQQIQSTGVTTDNDSIEDYPIIGDTVRMDLETYLANIQ